MNYKSILTYLFSFLYVASSSVYAQISSTELLNQQASIPIPNPSVAALNKFVEFPVSHFNGQVDVSFPLYEIKLKNVSVPITLKYHTGGIRVSEEPSWVGLGWALDAGGVISHQVNGKDDVAHNNAYTYYGWYLPSLDKAENETYNEGIMFRSITKSPELPTKNGQMENVLHKFWYNYDKIDGDPDLYIYNMGNYSGKFINWDNTGTDLSCNNMLFKQYIGNILTGGDSIIATDPNGNIYRFKNIETSFSMTGLSSPYASVPGQAGISAYHLSEIMSPNGERIKFHYKTFKQLITDNHWESQFPNYANGANPPHLQNGYYPLIPALFEECSYYYEGNTEYIRLRSYTFLNALYLEKIEFPSGTIEFIKSPREDAYGLKLDKIYVRNNDNQQIKTITFQYDYFEAANQIIGTEVMTATNISASAVVNYPENYLRKRLKLLSFSENNNNETQSETCSFSYVESEKLPYKTSFAQDFWGYYNEKLNYTLLPGYHLHDRSLGISSNFGSGSLGSRATADRNVNASAAKAGMLKEITHPTSGKTTLDFESNQCISNAITSLQTVDRWINASDYGSGYKQTEFTFEEKKEVAINVVLGNKEGTPIDGCTGGEQIYLGDPFGHNVEGFYAVIEKYDPDKKQFMVFDARFVWWATQTLRCDGASWYESGRNEPVIITDFQPGRYRLTASFPDSRTGSEGSRFVSLSVSYKELVTSTTGGGNYLTGGLRVKKVMQTDPVGNTSIEKQYTYKNGILATNPVFTYSTMVPVATNQSEFLTKTSLSTSPVYPYSFSANGSLVGYRNVTETYSNGEIGKTEYTYEMDADISGVVEVLLPPTPKLTNGFLLSKYVYDKDGNAIYEKKFDYQFLNMKVYWGFKVHPLISCPVTGIPLPSLDAVLVSRMYVYFYPIIQGKIANRKENESLGMNAERSAYTFRTHTEYKYNMYCQVVSKEVSNNTSGKIIETYKYVSEKAAESGGVYTLMKNRNILSPLIETQIEHNGAITKQITNYSQPYTNIFKPSNFQLQSGDTPVETRITFDNYDKFGNSNSINKDNTGAIIYLWSYNGMYPVAEIRNSDYATVNAALGTVGLGSIETLSANVSPDKAKLDNLRNVASLAKAHITTYKYLPLVGIVEATAPNGITTYYKYDSFNRLETIEDHNHRGVESYEYHYKN